MGRSHTLLLLDNMLTITQLAYGKQADTGCRAGPSQACWKNSPTTHLAKVSRLACTSCVACFSWPWWARRRQLWTSASNSFFPLKMPVSTIFSAGERCHEW